MKLIAQIPGLPYLFNCNPVNQTGCQPRPGIPPQGIPRVGNVLDFTSLGSFISGLLNITFLIAAFLTFFWLVWAAFQYIAAGGDKQKLAQARSRVTWAIVGLLLIAIAFLVAQFAQQIIQPKGVITIL